MPALAVKDYKLIKKFLVSLIIELKESNRGVNIPMICDALESEIHGVRALNDEYLAWVKAGVNEDKILENDEEPDEEDSKKIDYGKYHNQEKLMRP